MDDQPKLKILVRKSLIQTVKNAIGVPLFRNLYAELNGNELDVLNDGELSCAVFVSSILAMYGLIDKGHSTVDSTVKHMRAAGWGEIGLDSPEAGDIIVWDTIECTDSHHKHVGFYIGNHQAISNSSRLKTPRKHDWAFGGTRQPNFFLRYDFNKRVDA